MAVGDPFLAFRLAFEEQRSTIQCLHDRVSKLEALNNEVISFVKQTGNLPNLIISDAIVERVSTDPVSNCHAFTKLMLPRCSPMIGNGIFHNVEGARPLVLEDASQSNSEELFSDTSTNTVPKSCQSPQAPMVDLLSDFVTQQTAGLGKALETLGFEPSRHSQLLDEIRSNMSTILLTKLTQNGLNVINTATTPTVSPASSAAGVALPAYASPNSSLAFYSGEGSLCSIPPVPANAVNPTVHACLRSSGTTHFGAPNSTTPTNWSPSNSNYLPTDILEKRRLELLRTNKRMHSTPGLQPTNTPQTTGSIECFITASVHPSVVAGCAMPTPLPRTKSVITPVPDAGDEVTFKPTTTIIGEVEGLTSHVPRDSSKPNIVSCCTDRYCPCGDRYRCPLTLAKQRRFTSDPRVQLGFIRVAAVFRGRFVRQLLATHKVYDLIRTVKDTAKLALSIHVERQVSGADECDEAISDRGPLSVRTLSNEELVLESRLLAQLRGALNQLHDIFFNWPLSNQIELMHLSRSLPQRTRRIPTKSQSSQEDPRRVVSSQASDVCSESRANRITLDSRRRWDSMLSPSTTSSSGQRISEQTRVLRQLQSDQIDRFSTQILARESAIGTKETHFVSTDQPDSPGLRRQPQRAPTTRISDTKPTTLTTLHCTSASKLINGASMYKRLHPSTPAYTTKYSGTQIESPRNAKENLAPARTAPPTRTCVTVPRTSTITKSAHTTPKPRTTPTVHRRSDVLSGGHRRPYSSISNPTAQTSSLGKQFGPDLIRHSYQSGGKSNETAARGSEDTGIQQSPHTLSTVLKTQHPKQTRTILVVAKSEQPTNQTQSDVSINADTHHLLSVTHGVCTSVSEKTVSLASINTGRSLCQLRQNSHRTCQFPQPVRAKRPISGPLGQMRMNTNATGVWYPVRRRIIASQQNSNSVIRTQYSVPPKDVAIFPEGGADVANARQITLCHLATAGHYNDPIQKDGGAALLHPLTSKYSFTSEEVEDRSYHLRATWSFEPTD